MDAWIGIGTNRGRLAENLNRARRELAASGAPVGLVSSVWETEPVDAPGSGWFWNMVVGVRCALSPTALMRRLLGIERRAGRRRTSPNAPRILDLDLLLMGRRSVCSRSLELPHPRMWQRRFVLAPLAELAPALCNPATGRTVIDELARLPERPQVRRLGPLSDCSDGVCR